MKKDSRRFRPAPEFHDFILLPWHIGDRWDLTFNAVRMARRLEFFVCEGADDARSQFTKVLKVDCAAKRFFTAPPVFKRGFLNRVLKALRDEDVGMVSSGGVPCFSDPGGWLVRELREKGVRIISLGGASCLTSLLSLSGFDWIRTPSRRAFSFIFYQKVGNREAFADVMGRGKDPIIVFIEKDAFLKCLKTMEGLIGARRVSAFFDLTKSTSAGKYPYANQVRTMTCAEWLREAGNIRWEKVSDVALMVGPEDLLP